MSSPDARQEAPAPTQRFERDEAPAHTKRFETFAFVFIAFVLFPLLAIGIVGGFGFAVWMQHLMFGPPGS